MSNAYNHIYTHIRSLNAVDTHEHLPASNAARDKGADVLCEYLIHYFNRDIISSNMPMDDYKKLFDKNISIKDRFKLVQPYWERCRYTGYGQSLDIAVRELYGYDEINADTIESIDCAFIKTLSTDHFHSVLKDKCGITTSLLDSPDAFKSDRVLFSPVFRIDPFIYIHNYWAVFAIEKEYGVHISRLEDMEIACRKAIIAAADNGAAAFKSGLAYDRSIIYEPTPRSEAEVDFIRALNQGYSLEKADRVFMPGAKYQNYMMHFALSVINGLGHTIQFHTGIQEGSGNLLANSNPEHLNTLFLMYPNAKFDIFHIGYPYHHVLSALAKMFSNVYIDMCWANIISPPACVQMLCEWLETMPYNKISAFGGDYCFIDGVLGHLRLAQKNVAKALSIKVGEGLFSADKACDIARALFIDNPRSIFKI